MRERLNAAAGVGTRRRGAVGRERFTRSAWKSCAALGSGSVCRPLFSFLDRLDAVTLLENHLAELNLKFLDNLYDPAMHLGGILGQIGRAKDELCPPERYAALCETYESQRPTSPKKRWRRVPAKCWSKSAREVG